MCFYINNIKVSFSFWFFALISSILIFTEETILFYGIFFILLHEMAHLFIMLTKEEKISAIVMKPFGVEIIKHQNSLLSYEKELCIYMAGIVLNFVLFFCFLMAYYFTKNQLFLMCSSMNFLLFLFNGLPISVLDGGQILKILCLKKYDIDTAEKKYQSISVVCSFFLLVGSVGLFILGYCNITIVITVIYLFFQNFS